MKHINPKDLTIGNQKMSQMAQTFSLLYILIDCMSRHLSMCGPAHLFLRPVPGCSWGEPICPNISSHFTECLATPLPVFAPISVMNHTHHLTISHHAIPLSNFHTDSQPYRYSMPPIIYVPLCFPYPLFIKSPLCYGALPQPHPLFTFPHCTFPLYFPLSSMSHFTY